LQVKQHLKGLTETDFNRLRGQLIEEPKRRYFLHFQHEDRFPDQYPPLDELLSNNPQAINRLNKTYSKLTPAQRQVTEQWYHNQLQAKKEVQKQSPEERASMPLLTKTTTLEASL